MHVGVSVRPRERALEVHVAVCRKYVSNCSGFGHNASVREPELSIGSGCRSQGEDLLVSGPWRRQRPTLNNSAATSAWIPAEVNSGERWRRGSISQERSLILKTPAVSMQTGLARKKKHSWLVG